MVGVVLFLSCISLSIVLLYSALVSSSGEDSWKHYQQGGMFLSGSPSGFSDGRKVVFASACSGRGDIYLHEHGNRQPLRLTTSERYESSPLLTTDGARIVFAQEHEGRRHLWIMSTDGSNMNQVTDGNVLDDPIAVSSDGRHLLFARSSVPFIGQGRSMSAHVVRIDGSEAGPIHTGSLGIFTPDSKNVVFTEDQEELWVIDLESPKSSRRRFPGRGWPIAFSQDGRYLVTGRRPAGAPWTLDHEIWVRDLSTDTELRIAVGHSPVMQASGDQRILYLTGLDQLAHVASVDGRTVRHVPLPPGRKTPPRLSLDGESVFFGIFVAASRAEYDVVAFSFDDLRPVTVASACCRK